MWSACSATRYAYWRQLHRLSRLTAHGSVRHLYYNKKLSCCCDSRSYCARRTVYWRTLKPVSLTNLRTAGTHDPNQRVEFMNAPIFIYSSVTTERDRPKFTSSQSQRITKRNTTSVHLIVCLQKTHVRVFFDSCFRCVLWLNDTTAKMSEGTNRNLPARTRWYNF